MSNEGRVVSFFDNPDFGNESFDINNDNHITIKIYETLKATSILVGILKHYKKLEVPRDIFKEVLIEEQMFPNDFITKNGSMMIVTYDQNTKSYGFELGYKDSPPYPEGTLGFTCTRSSTQVGYVDYDSPHYRE